MSNTYYEWNGFCPESFLKGERIRMRLNKSDFYESEATGLQIARIAPGAFAVVLHFRGEGKFRSTATYADEQVDLEMLCKQNKESMPFVDEATMELLDTEDALNDYISIQIPEPMDLPTIPIEKTYNENIEELLKTMLLARDKLFAGMINFAFQTEYKAIDEVIDDNEIFSFKRAYFNNSKDTNLNEALALLDEMDNHIESIANLNNIDLKKILGDCNIDDDE